MVCPSACRCLSGKWYRSDKIIIQQGRITDYCIVERFGWHVRREVSDENIQIERGRGRGERKFVRGSDSRERKLL